MQANEPELLITGGTIRTMDPELGSVEAVGIAGGRIKAVGTREEVTRGDGPGRREVDLSAARRSFPG